MSKGYWIGHVTVEDPQAYQAYRDANARAFAKYGARFLIRGGPQEVVEGQMRDRSVVIEFPSVEQARACYHSPEYAAARALREPCSIADVAIVEGWDNE